MENKRKDVISIIIPAHNVEKYISKCLDSIIKQTYENIDVVVINDSSNDNTEKICKEYISKDNRIRLYFSKYKSAGLSRNLGIEKALGDYLIFVDSDDYLEPNTCEKYLNELQINKVDAVFSGYKICSRDNVEEISLNNSKCGIFSKNDIRFKIINNAIWTTDNDLPLYAVWNGIYSKKIIQDNNILFKNENEYFSEDCIFNYIYLSFCNKVLFISDKLYNHTMDNLNSITNVYNKRYDNIDNWYNYLEQYAKANKLNNTTFYQCLYRRYLIFYLIKIKQECKNNSSNKTRLYTTMEDTIFYKIMKSDVEVDFKYKLIYILSKFKLKFLIYLIFKIKK